MSLLAAEGVNDAAGAEKQQRLEECVRHQVKDRSGVGSDAKCENHETQLAHR